MVTEAGKCAQCNGVHSTWQIEKLRVTARLRRRSAPQVKVLQGVHRADDEAPRCDHSCLLRRAQLILRGRRETQ